MAIDSRDRRASAIGVALPSLRAWPLPDGSLTDRADRQHCAYLYRLFDAIPDSVPSIGQAGGAVWETTKEKPKRKRRKPLVIPKRQLVLLPTLEMSLEAAAQISVETVHYIFPVITSAAVADALKGLAFDRARELYFLLNVADPFPGPEDVQAEIQAMISELKGR